MKGIYAGFFVNSFRQSFKHLYRTPINVFVPQFFADSYPKSLQITFPTINKVSAGAFLALTELIIICPLERIKTVKMTSPSKPKKKVSHRFFLNAHQKHNKPKRNISLSYLYNGGKAFLYRQMASWITFMYLDTKLKMIIRKQKNYSPLEKIKFMDLIMVSIGTSIGNIMFGNTLCINSVLPFDRIKTIFQMDVKSKHKKSSILKSFTSIYKKEGFLSFYSGWQATLLQGFIQIFFTSFLLEFLENMKVQNSMLH